MPRLYTLSPSEKNYTQIQGENGGGILDSGDITSINQRISPPENYSIIIADEPYESICRYQR